MMIHCKLIVAINCSAIVVDITKWGCDQFCLAQKSYNNFDEIGENNSDWNTLEGGDGQVYIIDHQSTCVDDYRY